MTPMDKLVRGKDECLETFVFGPLGAFSVTVCELTSDFLFFVLVVLNTYTSHAKEPNGQY